MKLRTPQSEGERFVRLLFDEKGRVRSDNEFVRTSLYSIHITNWLKYFSMDQILLVHEEDIRRNLAKVLREVELFLQIKTFFQPSMFQHKKRTCFIHDGVERCSPRWGSELPKPCVNETLKQKLRDFFRPFNREFEKAVGQTFLWTNW
ncbi:Heparan sulfate glucosamine 3-O-sulfotransferase 6 [Holothuria leucospilota]|uniref:Heparan sulfate glucosamine 3-O-sulfotransferase 6 n=1 Tax=Holothuria leucospilota TaxID=206669 RepID=A0A9Q0YBR7_HOLLE|nr:Heparan sulfate glucosamine 3-O-sulfotransferase 6 [Holothuria leucospilota]